eukprot:786700-Rhodomonas_salina.1
MRYFDYVIPSPKEARMRLQVVKADDNRGVRGSSSQNGYTCTRWRSENGYTCTRWRSENGYTGTSWYEAAVVRMGILVPGGGAAGGVQPAGQRPPGPHQRQERE